MIRKPCAYEFCDGAGMEMWCGVCDYRPAECNYCGEAHASTAHLRPMEGCPDD